MDATDRIRRMLDELGIEWWHDDDISPGHTEWMTDDAVYTSLGMDGDMLTVKAISKMTPEQAIAATVGGSDVSALRAKVKAQSDYIGKLRGEYKALDEQMERRCAVYRATIRKLKDELDAATVGEEHEMHICKRCGVAYELNIIDKGYGKPRFCPNCGHKGMYQ